MEDDDEDALGKPRFINFFISICLLNMMKAFFQENIFNLDGKLKFECGGLYRLITGNYVVLFISWKVTVFRINATNIAATCCLAFSC